MMKNSVSILLAFVMALAASVSLDAQTNNGFTVIKDLSVNGNTNNIMRVISRTVLPGQVPKLMFPVADANDRIQVHAYDETNGVVNITPTLFSFNPHNSPAGSLLYFQGGMPLPYSNGQPWVTDGTPSGSHQLITVNSSCGYLSSVCATTENGITYLRFGEVKCRGGKGGGASGISGMNAYLYKTDGTAGGTVKLKSWSGSTTAGTYNYRSVNNWCLFSAYDGGNALWRSNGTSKGTTALKSFNSLREPVVLNGYYIFPGDDGINGLELWRSNATAAGTTLVANLALGSASSTPDYLTALGSYVYFTADDGTGVKLYRYDPALNLITVIPMNASAPKWLTGMGGKLYYSAWTETEGRELWVYDPSVSQSSTNPHLVMDFVIGAPSSDPHYGEPVPEPNMYDLDRFFAVVGEYLYFAAKTTSTSDYTICRSNGSTVEAVAGLNVTRPNSFTVMGNKLYFIAFDATNGYQLYKFDPALYTPPATPKLHNAAVSPEGIALGQNYPNPFNPSTVITYYLPLESAVTLTVTDMFGREVARLIDGERRMAGTYNINFDAHGLPSGMYVYRLEAGGAALVRKMVLMR